MARQAAVLPCQDIRLEYDGKFTIVGLFTSNIAIPVAPSLVPQIAFLLILDGDLPERLKSLAIELHFPGAAAPSKMDVPLDTLRHTEPLEGQRRWRFQFPMVVGNAVLNPGRIVCKIIHDQGEIETGAGWIVTTPLLTPSVSPSSKATQPPSEQSRPDVSPTA